MKVGNRCCVDAGNAGDRAHPALTRASGAPYGTTPLHGITSQLRYPLAATAKYIVVLSVTIIYNSICLIMRKGPNVGPMGQLPLPLPPDEDWSL